MAITWVKNNQATGKAVSLTTVTAGNLIVCLLQWQDGTNTPTLSDGTNSPDAYSTVVNRNNKQLIRIAYWLSSPKSGSVTYTWTHSGGGGYTCHAFEVAPTSGYTFVLDHIDAGGTGASTTFTTASETSAETSMVAFGAWGKYTNAVLSSQTIDDVAPDYISGIADSSYGSYSYLSMRVMNNPGTYAYAGTSGSNADWAADLIGFKEASSGGASAVPANRGNLGMMMGMSVGMWLDNDFLKPTGGN